ncbi:CoA-transferase [Halomonas sp. CUBES01]|uniref:acyl CoA:acetate/3-ketoacid CoA transferase n=1 Tax=Halomonas sp. CUBES01 TaxID=2897340 RepID=UPI001E3C73AE|nr:CoA-transferase [Halomonas sp. CUBES01]MEC4766598.1 CoA-transferase [Halomonas sp. CUBES01]
MKVITAEQASQLIKSEATLSTGGFGSCGHPEALTAALAERFIKTGQPQNLTLIFAAGQGDKGERGLNRLAIPGLIKRVIGGYWALTPMLGKLALAGTIEAHNWPQGVISHLYRTIAAGAPGVITKLGLGTFIEPDQDGGRIDCQDTSSLVRKILLEGESYLLYPALPLNCVFIRGTRCDRKGNLSMEAEANFHDVLTQAMAARNSGGIVIAQVEEICEPEELSLKDIRVPGILIDYVVISEKHHHWQTYGTQYNADFVSRTQATASHKGITEPMPVAKKIIAQRALMEIEHFDEPVVNLGIGLPEKIATVARDAGIQNLGLTVESGAIGGFPAGDMSFGASMNPEAVIDQPSIFDFYNGGGVDIAFLSFAEVGAGGHVNVAKLGKRINGVGGFVNIAEAAKNLVFCGTFTAGGLETHCTNGRLIILKEGSIRKFRVDVEKICFNAHATAPQKGMVLYVTERCVLRWESGQLLLIEIAPGIDLVQDILNQSDTPITVSSTLRLMPTALFETAQAVTVTSS